MNKNSSNAATVEIPEGEPMLLLGKVWRYAEGAKTKNNQRWYGLLARGLEPEEAQKIRDCDMGDPACPLFVVRQGILVGWGNEPVPYREVRRIIDASPRIRHGRRDVKNVLSRLNSVLTKGGVLAGIYPVGYEPRQKIRFVDELKYRFFAFHELKGE